MIDLISNDYEGEDVSKFENIIRTVDKYLIDLNRPKDFRHDNPDNILNQMDESFENICNALKEAGITDPKSLTVYEFYSSVQYFERKHEKLKRKNN